MDPSDLSSVDLENLSLSDFPPALIACAVIGSLVIYLVVWAIICSVLQKNVRAIPEEHRQLGTGSIWLMLIPIFNIAWLFIIVRRISGSWKSFFSARGDTDVGECAAKPGLWCALTHAFCNTAQFIPNPIVQVLVLIVSLAFFILLVVYLILLNDLRHKASKSPEAQASAAE